MKGKQTSIILYNENDHMDVFHRLPGEPHGEGGSHYRGSGDPTFNSSLAICDDEKRYPNQGENGIINKFKNVWHKRYEDFWMNGDSHYWMGMNNLAYRYYAEQYWYASWHSFPGHKQFCTMGFSIQGTDIAWICHCSGQGGIVVLTYGGKMLIPIRWITSYSDKIDGKIYDFSDNPRREIWVSQNGRDWYPVFIKQNYPNGTFSGPPHFVYAARKGFYLADDTTMAFVDLTLGDEDPSITCTDVKFIPNASKFNRNNCFSMGTNLFSINRKNERINNEYTHYYLEANAINPLNHFWQRRIYEGDRNNFVNEPKRLGIIGNKTYFYCARGIGAYSGARTYYHDPSYDNIEYVIFSLDLDGNFKIERKEIGTTYSDDIGRIFVNGSKMDAVFGNIKNILYDENTKYFYVYAWVKYTNPHFPKSQPEGKDYSRVIIAKTKDFKNITYHVAPSYRLLTGMLGKNKIAFIFDTQYDEELKAHYIAPRYEVLGFASYYSSSGAWCFHNEKLCPPYGAFGYGELYDYNNPAYRYSGLTYVWYFHDHLLQPNDKDFVYSLREWKQDGSVAYDDDSQTVLNKLYGLNYPGKDEE